MTQAVTVESGQKGPQPVEGGISLATYRLDRLKAEE
jgi:hypothetical protein